MKTTSSVVRSLLWIATAALVALGPTRSALADQAIAFDSITGKFGGYWSSTPEGGSDFKHKSAAADAALANARLRGCLAPVVVWDSNLTGYYAVAVGLSHQNTYRVSVQWGSTRLEADTNAIHALQPVDELKRVELVCSYFSYGRK